MAKAQMKDIRSSIEADGIRLDWVIVFHGPDVARPDSDLATVTLPFDATKTASRTAIRNATMARATALGYSVPSNGIYTLEELFAGV